MLIQSRAALGVDRGHRPAGREDDFFPVTIQFAPRLLWTGAATVLGLACLLGGGTIQGLRSDALIQVAGLGLLGLVGWQSNQRSSLPALAWPIAIIAALGVLIFAQLIWLPPMIWTRLPGREQIASAYAAADIALPWLPISLDPEATWRSVLSLIPPVAVFLAVPQLPARSRRSLSFILIGFGLVNVLVGLAQLMLGPESPIYLYPITNEGSSVGFFANRNHYAAFLYSVIPLASAWAIGCLAGLRLRLLWVAAFLLAGALLLLGIGMSQSRAGIFLGLLAGLSGFLFISGKGTRTRAVGLASIAAMLLIAIVLVIQFGLSGILGRLDTGIAADYRFVFDRITAKAALAFQPVGSGFGTFPAVYKMFEQPQDLFQAFANHAHNDWLEVWLEGGFVAIALALAFLAWLGRAGLALWRDNVDGRRPIDTALGRAGAVTVVLLLLHSAVDYPLRTTAVMCTFAFACALMVEPPSPARTRRG